MVSPLPIPFTQAKLPRSIVLRTAIDSSQFDLTAVSSQNLAAELTKTKKIGAVYKIAVDQRLDLHEWREFDADLGGQIVEWAPGKETIGLRLTGIILYQADILETFGFDVSSLLEISPTFVLDMVERRPVAGGGIQSRSTYFIGCRFANRPFEADIHEANLIIQEVEAQAARVLKTNWQ